MLQRMWLSLSRQAAGSNRRRVAAVFHTLAVAAAEEGDRRASVLAATAADVDGVRVGALVDDLDGLLDGLGTDWVIDGGGDGDDRDRDGEGDDGDGSS